MTAARADTGPTTRAGRAWHALRAARRCDRPLRRLLLAPILLPAPVWAAGLAAITVVTVAGQDEPSTSRARLLDARTALPGAEMRANALFGLRPPATTTVAAAPLGLRPPTASSDAAPPRPRDDADAAPSWGTRSSHAIPALEIVGFQALLNRFDRAYFGCCDFDVDLHSIRRNLRSRWVVDSDTFTVNQLGHPYQGSVYHGLARASGLGYWESAAYTFAGSALWEIAGETTPPSRNDQIASGIGGSFLGEALFRMSNLWLEQGRGSRFWREVVAGAISPPVGFNRAMFDQRFKGIFPSNDPDYYSRIRAGVVSATQNGPGSATEVKRSEAIVDFALEYGLPGKRGYTYRRPFDYFAFQASASSATGFESVSTEGLLFGTDYELGNDYRGIWGIYGSYAYMAPQIFRLASTAVSLGTTAEWRVSDAVVMQGSALGGLGYATVSTIGGIQNERANNYGVAPQALLALRMILGDRVSLEASARQYNVSGLSGGNRDGHDEVMRADAALTWRIHRRHAVTLRYQLLRRDFDLASTGGRTDTRATVGIFYTLLGLEGFGIGNWH